MPKLAAIPYYKYLLLSFDFDPVCVKLHGFIWTCVSVYLMSTLQPPLVITNIIRVKQSIRFFEKLSN